MRPSLGGDALPCARPRSRKSSVADQSAAHVHAGPSSHAPTTFFLRSEDDMEQSLADSQDTEPVGRQRESAFGVQSLADTLEAAFGPDGNGADKTAEGSMVSGNKDNGSPRSASGGSSKTSSRQSESLKSSPMRKLKRKVSNHAVSNPLTPLNIDERSPVPTSAMPSTPKSVSLQSLKLSDEESCVDDAASQAIISSGEDEEEEDTQHGASTSFPQLVMPSIQMPTRRPFTSKGKVMGKLKVLIAGEAGIGKSSLIRSIVQLCEDIVHVDPLSTSQSLSQSPPPKSKPRKMKAESAGTTKITEIHASTKAYPHWYTDLEESRAFRRRKSSTIDGVLERNICFVDTPGFTQSNSRTEDMSMVVDYVESLLYQTSSMESMEDSDLLGVVSGSGGISVDVVLYLLPPSQDISRDIEFMQRLSSLTNVIPVIAKSDTLSPSDLVTVKTSILARLQSSSFKPFFFGKPLDDALLAVQGLPIVQSSESDPDPSSPTEPSQYPFTVPTYPYAISSTPGPDHETMDASLLMSPDYVQPLLPSELAVLVNQVFDPESIAWLRHSAAKKFLSWRRRARLPPDSFILNSLQQQPLHRGSVSSASVGLNGAALNASATSSMFSAASPSGVLVPRVTSPFYSNSNSNLQSPFPVSSPSLSHSQLDTLENPTDFSLARYNNYNQGEQRLTEVRLAKWATDLQRSLRNERERFEELQRNERARWLLERVGEEVTKGNIVSSPGGSPRADWAVVRRGNEKQAIQASPRYARAAGLDSRDPLGLCDFSDEIRRRGFVLVKVLGGVSVIGAVVVAVVRICGVGETVVSDGPVKWWTWLTGGVE